MTRPTSQGIAVLVGVIYLSFSGVTLLINRGLAAQTHDTSHLVPTLIEALTNADPDVRYAAALALADIGPAASPAVPALIEAFKDADPGVRWAAVRALASIEPAASTVVPALIEALTNADPGVRWAAVRALGDIGPAASPAVPALIEAFKDADSDVRYAAIRALASIEPAASTVVPALIEALKGANADAIHAAAVALQNIGPAASPAVPALIEALTNADPDGRYAAAQTLATIALAARDARATHMIGPLKAARHALLALADRDLYDTPETVSYVIEFLELLWWRDLREKLWQWMYGYPHLSAVIAAYPALLLCWLIFHGLRPLWLYRINEALKPYTDFALPAQLGGIKIPLRYVLLVGFFHYSRRMLDAWITQHLRTAREEFLRKATVSDRAVHIPVPVVLDGQAVPYLTVEQLRPTFNKNRACILIWGEGGAGKTSLAYQVAKWAMADIPIERLCAQHRMLPVLIEQALELKDTERPHPFMDALRGELRALTHEEDPIPEEFLLRLLQRRRILVIVDHFSEMPEATRQEIRPGQPEFPVNAFVVTSRLEERLGGVPPTTVKPLRIQGNRLSSFLEAYLTQHGKREYFDDAEFFEACRRLSLMVGTRDITVLLAKLYAEQLIAAKEGLAEGILPDTIPDLMLSYVNEVNRGIDRPKQADRTVHRATKVIAWECLKRTYRPTTAPREDVLDALRGEQDVEDLLSYLEDRLRLIQTAGAGRNQIRFALDPLAEYLAGLYVVEAYGDNIDAWEQFFAHAEALPGGPDAIRGFLLAVRDCCLAQGVDSKVPAIIVGELAKRAGMEAGLVKLGPA